MRGRLVFALKKQSAKKEMSKRQVVLTAGLLLQIVLLQIDGLCQAEVEMAIGTEDNVSIFLTGARSRAGRTVSFLPRTTLGKDTGGLDRDRPAADVQTHEHDAQIARLL